MAKAEGWGLEVHSALHEAMVRVGFGCCYRLVKDPGQYFNLPRVTSQGFYG